MREIRQGRYAHYINGDVGGGDDDGNDNAEKRDKRLSLFGIIYSLA